MSPVTVLPNELLRCIFQHLPRRGLGNADVYDRLHVAHVCKIWRELAIGYSDLWTDVVYASPSITSLSLEWSSPRAITVKMQVVNAGEDVPAQGVENRVESVRLALVDLSRVETVDLFVPRDFLLKLAPSFAGPAPQLRSLRLGLADWFRVPSEMPMPANLVAPRLDTFIMERGIAIDWNSPTLSCSLRSLSLAAQNAPAESLTRVLQMQPRLQELAIEWGNLPREWLPRTSIDLPCLQHLRLHGDARALSKALEVIHVPPPASVDIAITELLVTETLDVTEADIAAFLQEIRGILAPRGSASTIYLSSEACAVTARYWPSAHHHAPIVFNDAGDPQFAVRPAVSIAFRDPGMDCVIPFAFRETFARLLADVLPLKTVRSLTLGAPLDLKALAPLLERMDGTRTLYFAPALMRVDTPFHGINVLDLIFTDLIGFFLMFCVEPDVLDVLFPALREMVLVGVPFPVLRGENKGWEVLMMCFKMRKILDIVLRQLRVVDCEGVGALSGTPAMTVIIEKDGRKKVKKYTL